MTQAADGGLIALGSTYDLTQPETERLQRFDDILLDVNAHTNLIGRNGLETRWQRHYEDSLQLFSFLPVSASHCLDIGSGAGFPGLVLAVLAADRLPSLRFLLMDSVKKKAAFLRAAADHMGLNNVSVSDERAEVFHVKHQKFDVITARAVAALDRLLPLAAPLMQPDGVLIFPKGENAETELTAARTRWTFDVESHPSKTHEKAQILVFRRLEHRK